jgi:predicted amidohydrolase YtcJ
VDLHKIPARDLLTTKVNITIAGGRIVYQHPETLATH